MNQQLCRLFYFVMLLVAAPAVNAQQKNGQWMDLFNAKFDGTHGAIELLWDSIKSKPAAEKIQLLHSFETDKSIISNDAGRIKLGILKMRFCTYDDGALYNNRDWRYWGNSALAEASLLEDDYLAQSCFAVLGDTYLRNYNYDTGIFYLMKSIELAEKIGYNKKALANYRIAASNPLFRTQNYRQCIEFCSSTFDIESAFSPIVVITSYNNRGLSYLKLGKTDSATWFFTKGVTYAHSKHWGVWEGILLGNIGDALYRGGKPGEAMAYWQKDYDSSMKYQEYGNAALTVAYMSRYQFDHGEQQKAVNQLNWAEHIAGRDQVGLIPIYKIKAEVYRKMGLHDSADILLALHYQYADSLNHVINRNNYNSIQLKLDYENNANEYKLLKKARLAEVSRRNFLAITLVCLLAVGLLLYNRQRLKIKLARQHAAIAEAERKAATEQLAIFTQTLLEKNEQIEKLNVSLQQQAIAGNDELIHQTLLTDYDWNRFKELFEKIHPRFFANLKTAAPAVTQSEMRLAALTKLNLDNKQMASMQGISVSSLRGNKTRLRQKLNIPAETSLEDLIKQL